MEDVVDMYRKASGARGRYETRDEYGERVRYELTESKRLLEEELGHEIHGLCLPGGGVTEEAVTIAREAGYRYFTLPSSLRDSTDSRLTARMIPRIGNLPRMSIRGRDLGYPTGKDFKNHLRMNNGYASARLLFALGKVNKLLRTG